MLTSRKHKKKVKSCGDFGEKPLNLLWCSNKWKKKIVQRGLVSFAWFKTYMTSYKGVLDEVIKCGYKLNKWGFQKYL